jgi:tetratricopeptide (TPR) repeat protein
MPLPPDDPFMLALDAYQAKRFDEAAMHCQTALQNKPDNPACLHLMGAIEFCFGHRNEAENLMRRSITLKPGFAEIHYSFAQVLAAQGKNAEALEHYKKTLELKPDHADALFGMGNVLALLGQRENAAKAYEQTLKIRPEYPEALNNLGVFRFENGDFDEAIRLEQRAIDLRPQYAAAHNNLGNAYKEKKFWAKAIGCYRRALAHKPDLFQAVNNMGLALMYGASDLPAAASCFRQVLEQHPDNVAAMTHLGITLCMEGNFAEGVAWYEKALALQPDYRDALNNMGNALRALGRVEEALSFYERVKATKPDDPEIHNNMAMALLTAGRFLEGWSEYEWRWKTAQLAEAKRSFPQPQWRGEEAEGRTLLIHAEQGFGDTLQFCRYAPMAAKLGWKVILEVQPELVSLINSLKGVDKVFPSGAIMPPFDFHCPMMSLPVAFKTQVDTIPADIPYLFADKKKTKAWRERLSNDPKGLKAGLVWTGNPRLFSLDLAAANVRRSLMPESLAPLAGLKNVQFYSLQKGGFKLGTDLGLIDTMDECKDFSDTAALIANLDLIISVDTSVAHLAGALGKPVWLLNRFDSCWRWFREREDSPWYPTMRIFRQPSSGDWASVIERVKDQLITAPAPV